MNLMKTLVLAMPLFLTACATVHKSDGHYAKVIDNGKVVAVLKDQAADGLTISSTRDKVFSSFEMPYIEVTFQNVKSDVFAEISDVTVDFGDQKLNQAIQVVSGPKLAAWWEGTRNRITMEEWNRAMALSAIAIGGAVVAGVSNDPTTKGVGALTALSAVGVMSIDDFNRARHATMDVKKETNDIKYLKALFPETHLLGGGVNVPPRMFIRRWLVLYSKTPEAFAHVQVMNVHYKINGGARHIQIESPFTGD